ncbi:MAG: putative orotidine 5-phosphate decarboxylase [Actinomycetia bacterium]|nr:putative orotidine 5-phosphate decarboxylase [Actinomycetes bacterium]
MARSRLAVALDVPDLDEASLMAKRVRDSVEIAKIGLELYSAAGPAAVERMHDLGFDVFLDLKLHDIPTTVGRAARVLGRLGVRYCNFHAAGGEAMVRAAVEGLANGARDVSTTPPVALAVTVLTSDPDASAFDARLATALAGGCGGVVCSLLEIERVKHARADFVTVVPGTRLPTDDTNDQARTGTPFEAARRGADVIVLGRTVTAAAQPEEVAAYIAREVAKL